MRALTDRLTYANVVATFALFIALGGTSFAVTQLARNSVGTKQIKKGGVASSDIRRGAVTSRGIRNGAVETRDLDADTREALRGETGPAGPPGPTYRAVVNSGGGQVRGNATAVDHQGGSARYAIAFDRDVSGCAATASLSDAQNGPTLETPPPGRVTVGVEGTRVLVRTYNAEGAAQDLPFSVIVAC